MNTIREETKTLPKLICAPMATLSHEAFRRCIESFGGCDEYFTEMINASSLINMGPFEKYYLMSGPVPQKIVWQLTGWDADTMAQAAKVLCPLGGIGIDINMGCSAPQIYKTGAGIAWMLKDINQTRDLVHKVKHILDEYEAETSCHMRLSVKCRLGAEDYTDEGFFAFTDMLVSEGVELITLHARTVKEKFRQRPRYEYVQKLCERYKTQGIKIILNGDIKDIDSARYALSIAPDVYALMIAREACTRPWIFDQIKCGLDAKTEYTPCHKVDREKVALDFIDDVVKYQPEEFWKTRIQRFFTYYCQQFAFGHYFQSRMLNYKNIEESIAEVKDYFIRQSSDKDFLY